MENQEMRQEAPVFALDIGTRTIIGIVGYPENGEFRVLDLECRTYDERAMVDGQIEDVLLVARLAQAVREALESRTGLTLRRAHIAAAGRALITQRALFELRGDAPRVFGPREIRDLETGALQNAYDALGSSSGGFFCVGYSVLRYTLDDYPFSTLIDHHGRCATAEVLATFLPSEVVESLYTVMARAGMEVASLTLEPIAAINAVIPTELRIVNLALVDIGAGTSDIALARGGSIAAYGMVTTAGDEITEELICAYLLEFDDAERVKKSLCRSKTVAFNDILGVDHSYPCDEVLQRVSPAVQHLSDRICEKILELNGDEAPAAVFLVGGGSQLPTLRERVAERLGVDVKKVAVGQNNYMMRLVLSDEKLAGPEFVTPVGIAITAARAVSNGLQLTLNGHELRLLKETDATVLDALFASGYKYQQIIGRSGNALQYELDGKAMLAHGGHATPGEISLNGRTAGISQAVADGDLLAFTPAVDGETAELFAEDVMADDASRGAVCLDGAMYRLGHVLMINDLLAAPRQRINDRDRLVRVDVCTVAGLCRFAQCPPETTLWRGDQPLAPESPVLNGDILTSAEPAPEGPVREAEPTADGGAAEGGFIRVALNGKQLRLMPKADGSPLLFVDLLAFTDIDPSQPPPGKQVFVRVNGADASFLQEINDGATVDVHWEN